MVKTVDEGFRELLTRLTPSDTETSTASQHRTSIEACLKQNFALTTLFRTGSFGFGTSIYGYSDVDYFAEIPQIYLTQNSTYTLQKVRDALQARFPLTTVGVRTPAVALYFDGGDQIIEVVPADYLSEQSGYGGYRIYHIPDGNGSWVESSPEKHKGWINKLDAGLSNKVKPFIRFIKAWRYYQNVPLSSFYIELRAAKYASTQNNIIYSGDMRDFLRYLSECELAAIQDPMGVSGLVQPCQTENQKEDALSKLNTAKTRAEKAWDSESNGYIKDAFDWWSLFYNSKFPSYY